MTKVFLIILTLGFAVCKGQSNKSDTTKKYEYEICVHKNAEQGHVIKNVQTGIVDTTIAYVSGQVLAENKPLESVYICFTSANGQVVNAFTDLKGYYKIQLEHVGEYVVKFYYAGLNPLTIDKLKLGTGQMQEITVSLGRAGGFVTYSIKTKKPLTEKEYNKLVKKMSDN